MRKILAPITSNRFKSIITGFAITSAIQSSTATTIMVVSFVNAGLLSLIESFGIIMGANIGTTITAWLIALLGFKLKISALTLPLVGLAFPLLFAGNNVRKYWGEFIVGFALIFIGLDFLQATFPDIKSNPELLRFISDYTHLGFGSLLIFMFIGLLITAIIQSSSVAIAFTFVMLSKGWINLEMGAAMIIGENIGTTITANIAAIVANKPAKRSALLHSLFNLIGMLWILPLLGIFFKYFDRLLYDTHGNLLFSNTSMFIILSIFHTGFNLVNTLLLMGFSPHLINLVKKIIPDIGDKGDTFQLKYINSGILSTAELSILQARKEIANYSKRITKMFSFVQKLFAETNNQEFFTLADIILDYERFSDKIEVEIANYLTKISENELSKDGSQRIRVMLKIVDDIESISDSCYNISKVLRRKKKEKIWFTQDIRNNINKMFQLLTKAFDIMNENLNKEFHLVKDIEAQAIEKEINKMRNDLKKDHLRNIENKNYKYQAGVIYNDIFSHCERMGDYIVNVSSAIAEMNKFQN